MQIIQLDFGLKLNTNQIFPNLNSLFAEMNLENGFM